jgi:hypothetical protein
MTAVTALCEENIVLRQIDWPLNCGLFYEVDIPGKKKFVV